MPAITEAPDSNTRFNDDVFMKNNRSLSEQWVSIKELYPEGANQPLLPDTFTREQFGQGFHFECFMLSALSTLVRFPEVIRHCFVTKKVRQDGRYTFQFFRGREWVKVEIDDKIALSEGDVLFVQSPTEHWWPLLLEKAYAKFYGSYSHLEGCTLQETYYDLTGNPVLNIPMDTKLAKAAGCEVSEGAYWLDVGQKVRSGDFVAAAIAKDADIEDMGLQGGAQYGILEIFSLTGGSAASDIVLHLHNPFEDEEYIYKGPLNPADDTWTSKLRAKYDVDNPRSIFMPLTFFARYMASFQLCYMSGVESDATYYADEWKGESAGGNPNSVTWRKNPVFYLRNTGDMPSEMIAVIKQEDQRRFTSPDESTKYLQCGLVVEQYTYPNPIPTFWITGNNHKAIRKSLFLNSREVVNSITIPPNSLCYLVPCCMFKGAEGKFDLAFYRMKNVDYSDLTVSKLSIPEMNWARPAEQDLIVNPQDKRDRVDFYVDESTDIHILLHQTKPFTTKTGGDVIAEDFASMYLYDDTDRRIASLHASTNFREISLIHHLPQSGRYAISITCCRAKANIPAHITIVGSGPSNVRIVPRPENAQLFDDEDDDVIDGNDGAEARNPIDYKPVVFEKPRHSEVPDSNTPYEDTRFYADNKGVTSDPWVHIGDLYPEGKNKPLLPDKLSRDQFEQGDYFECCCPTAFAALVDNHPDVIRNCFVSKNPRKDGRYTFQFHRYGQWVKVEIDDRIPQIDGGTLYCRSPTRHWWPLLLEKAYAKFYTLYQNLDGITQDEVFHDFSGRPVTTIRTDPVLAKMAKYNIEDPEFWLEMNTEFDRAVIAALTQMDVASRLGMQDDVSYTVLGFIPTTTNPRSLSDVLVKLYNPFEDDTYTGPMNKNDRNWSSDLLRRCDPQERNIIYMPVDTFCDVFTVVYYAYIKGPLEPAYNFNSEWGEGTNGGNTTLVTWRENPLYVVTNGKDEPMQMIAMIRQPDQRHLLHRQTNQSLNYIQCALILSESTSREHVPTYLVTSNNHRMVHKGIFRPTREVADLIIVPASSLCYLVPTPMQRDKGKFILSYWYLNSGDDRSLAIERLNPKVARQLPAIDHVDLRERKQERVDFLVDVPTDAHILVKQEKPFKNPTGGDAVAEDFIGLHLYDENNKRLAGTPAALNFREIGLVHHLDRPGRYALLVTCARGNGNVPCRVEVVGSEPAHVRITEAPENARPLCEVDLSFLDPEPEGVPLADVPIDSDPVFLEMLDALKYLHNDPNADPNAIADLEKKMNDRAHELAKGVIGKDRPKYLPNRDLDKLNPLLNADSAYMDTEKGRYDLVKDPRNKGRVGEMEEELRGKADEIAQQASNLDLGFLDPEYQGIPTADIEVMNDPTFAAMAQKRAELLLNPAANASKIDTLEGDMHGRADDLARAMHDKERFYLDPEPEGVPLDLLPLNEDPLFSDLEDELRALNRRGKRDPRAIEDLQDRLNDRAHELAGKLKQDERDLFLDPEPLGVPVSELPLDTDPEFHTKEVERLRLRKEDPIRNQPRIRQLEDELNQRARELAARAKDDLRGFLDPEPYGIPLDDLGLDYNDDFMKMEAQLRGLKKDPKRNAGAIEDLQDRMRDLVDEIAAAEAARDRAFLDPEPEGRLVQTLPLDKNPDFAAMDKERRKLKKNGRDPNGVRDLEDQMNDISHDIAHALNKEERPDYLEPTFKGIPFEELPLDDDQPFRSLEAKRQVQKRDPQRNARAIGDTENDLNDRAEELAKEKLAGDRAYLDPYPEGVPLELLPLDTDPKFAEMEGLRAKLKKDPRANAKKIAELEDALNDRAHELAKELKESERPKFLDPKPKGIPYSELPLDTDQPFRDMEIQRLLLKQNPQKNASAIQELEDAMNDRAAELAQKKKDEDRAFLDPFPLGVPLDELPLDDDRDFTDKEAQLRALKKDPRKNADKIARLEDELNDMARQMAADKLAKDRAFLDPEPEGRLLEDLPLSTDPEFRNLEDQHRALKKDPRKNAQKLGDLEDLMNNRAHELAKAMNAADRPKYLNPAPLGVPYEQLPLDEDEEFAQLEAKRARLLRNPSKNAKALKDVEGELNDRAEELAREKIQNDRAFLDPEPENIPIKYVPIDEDPAFRQMEAERQALKNKDQRKNDPRIRELERDMNDRAHDIAKAMKEKVRQNVLPPRPGGVARDALELDEDMPFTDLEAAYIKAQGDGELDKEADLGDAMAKRATDVASKMRADERARLDEPLGYSIEELPLDTNKPYLTKEAEVVELRKDPKRNAEKIAAGEDALNDMVLQMAKDKAAQERTFLDPEPEGRRVDDLNLDNDPTFRSMEEQYHRLKRDPFADQDRLSDLEQMMNDRARELARQKNAAERPQFLASNPKNVPLSELPLDTDEEFGRLEAERAKLNQDPRRNAQKIKDVEDKLNDRAEELAEEVLKNDRIYLEDEPNRVALRQVPFENDPTFRDLEQRRAALKSSDPSRNSDAIRGVEDQINNRLRDIAAKVKADGRKDMDQYPLGIPLDHLGPYLDEDKPFHDLEERYRDAKADPTKQKVAAQLLDQMNDRARDIAADLHERERRPLDQKPEGIPLSSLPLNDDPTFLGLENEAREIRNKNPKDPRLPQLQEQMDARAEQLANEARKAYVDSKPEGIPMELLDLGDDKDFTDLEAELRRLKQNPIANREKIGNLQKELNDMAHDKAREMLQGDRGYLDPKPEGVLLKDVPLDSDDTFRALENERARLKAEDPRKNAQKIKDLEDRLNDRAHELAQGVKDKEIASLEPDPLGVPYSTVRPYDDPEFEELAQHLRDLKEDPRRNAAAIRDVKDQMNQRGQELASQMLEGDRGYLDPEPEGVPLRYLPLNTDPKFHKLEAERARLKAQDPVRNAAKIQDLEDQLNDRARELAEDVKKEDLRGLDKAPEGIPLDIVEPHSDPKFASYLPQLRELKRDPRKNQDAIAKLQDAMNDRAHELAAEKLRGDRPAYLEPNPKRVPLDLLPLDDDPIFHDLEVQRAILKAQDPKRNAAKIQDLEDRLNDRAKELADEQRAKDVRNIDQEPNGVPLTMINPHDDPTFAALVDKHRELTKNPARGLDGIRDVEAQMEARARELADGMLEGDRDYLEPMPEGVPVDILPLDTDPKFRELEKERARLKTVDPKRNARKIQGLEDQLNDRAHELAREQLAEDLRGVNPHPRDVPLELLKPLDDPEFKQLVAQVRMAKKDPRARPQDVQDLVDAMNDRADELAAAAMDRNYLDPRPEGVPVDILPLDTDPIFHKLEVERAKLKLKDPKRNAQKIKDLEDQLNDRAQELAKQQLAEDLSGCDPAPEGIPLDLLRPLEDPKIAAMIPKLRELKKDPQRNADAIRDLEDAMNTRAYELADAMLEGDRGYLDPKPGGVPLAYLPLDTDPEFSAKEVERAKLKAQDPKRNARKIADLENQLNDRAHALAEKKKKEELALFPPQYEGIDTAALRPHDDPEFAQLMDQYRALEHAEKANSPQGRELLDAMDHRLEELAKERTDGDLYFLDKEPEGVPIEDVPIMSDPRFVEMLKERAALKANDPRGNAAKIRDLEDALNDRAHELAREMLDEDFDGVDPNPLGIPLELLNPRDDPQIARILPELRRAKKNPRDAQKAQDLIDKLNDRVLELAEDALKGDRPAYLDQKPNGVDLSFLPLDTDPIYNGLELERAKLKLDDPVRNAKLIEDLEDRLNQRAHELAQDVLVADLRNLDQNPEGLPIAAVKPHDNADFNALAEQARLLRQDPRRNADKLADIEDRMDEIAHEMAREMLDMDRKYLDPEPEGVPLTDLPLDEDPEFHDLEVQRALLKAQDPVRNKPQIKDLEDRLNDRALELAEEQKREDLRGLDPTPNGVPADLLDPHQDGRFASLLPELRRLKRDPSGRNQDRLDQLQGKLDDLLKDMADEYLAKDRPTYIDAAPEGIPLGLLPLDDDPEFKNLEAERLDLIARDPRANAAAIRDLEEALNDRAHEIAKDMRRNDRGYLYPEPEGVPLGVLPLDTDRQFADLEGRRAALKAKDPIKNAAAIRDLEDQLNDRAAQLARDQIAEDLRNIDPLPEDIPIELLKPHSDPEFARMVNALRAMKADPRPDKNKIAALEKDMNDRAHELADMALRDDRPQYLDPNPEGVNVNDLPLDTDPLYHQLEVERAKLKLQDPRRNAAKIQDLEDRLNDRAHELAKEQLAKDLDGVNKNPFGVPVSILNPHKDETFSGLAAQRRDPNNKSRGVDDPTKDLMNDRLENMAKDLLAKDRPTYLDHYPEGLPYTVLPLDTDPEFHDLEVQRAVLKAEDPRRNADKIKDLEDRLNDRAHELAKDALKGDRGYLDPEPEGVPVDQLPLDSDPQFRALENERAKLKAIDPKRNADKIKDLEDRLNDRAHELAQKQLKEDLEGLNPNPLGIPIESLNPHDDPEFSSYLPELRKLKEDPIRNAPRIKAIQGKLDDRAEELAKDKIAKDRAFLDSEPEGLPLAQLPLDTDKPFLDLEKQLRNAKRDPQRNADKIADLQDAMNDRAHELAREKIQGDRAYLDPEPEGIPIADVPIDSDPKFRQMEAERAKLKENPQKNASAIRDLEDALNDRAHELAAAMKKAERAFLNPTSHGIPKDLLPLDDDNNFHRMEQQLRKLNKDPRRNAPAIENLQEMMQDRADQLGYEMLAGDRPQYLDPNPEGVSINDLPLDTDPAYHDMEVQRAILKAEDPRRNADKIADLEKALNDRAHELAAAMRAKDRAFLDPEPEGIPIAHVPLDEDPNFVRQEDVLRKLKKDPRRNGPAIQDAQDRLNDRAHELAKGVVADDLAALPEERYRNIPKEDLALHDYPTFRAPANQRREDMRSDEPRATVKADLDAMDAAARDIADDVVRKQRAFLDQEPEGVPLEDLPLDKDPEFAALEDERRRRMKDPRAAKRNKDVIDDLGDKMNDRAHQMAKDLLAGLRGFMDPEPEGIPLAMLPLDTDPEFKDAEIARYKLLKNPNADPKKRADLEKRMNDRAHELAKAMLAKDRAFLDPEPEGVPLAYLPLQTDPKFNELAKKRQALKNSGRDPAGVRDLEDQMNDRAHDLAKDYLNKNRDYLNPEPQNVPIADIPLNRDPLFRDMENDLFQAKKDPKKNAEKIARLQDDLNDQADQLAKDLLKRERAHQNQEPLGVPLDELPLNYDPILNPLERKRRDLKKDPRRNAEALRKLEPEIEGRVEEIARAFLEKERAFLDQEPEGVPLSRLPLNDDRDFHEMEKDLRALKKQPAKNKDAIEDLEERLNDRAHELAKDQLAKDRAFLDPEPEGVPLADLPLNTDPKFRDMEEKRRQLKKDPRANAKAIRDLEDDLNDRAHELAKEQLAKDRAFLPQHPQGIPLKDLPLDKDPKFRDMEKQLRALKKDPKRNAEKIADLEDDMKDRVDTLAKRQLADDRAYLNPEPLGVPLAELDLNNDPEFRKLEQERRDAKRDPKRNADKIKDLERELNDAAERLAADYLKKDREYLDAEPEGVPVEDLPLNEDTEFRGMEADRRNLKKDPKKNAGAIRDLEDRLNDRARELARDKKGWQDPVFHEANENISEQWPRIRELYPEGVYDPVTPDTTLPSDVCSAPQDMSYLAPFIAALSRHTVLISRLFQDKAHPQNQPYRITLFNPDSSPVTVEIDDRVPCDAERNPKFTQVPSRMWYPLLLEKAYAKFVGGYENFNNCNAHDTLRDLTGRPVVHISLEDPKHAAATNMGDYTTPAFWRRVMEDLGRGDIFVCVANNEVPNGLHPLCSYALMDVVEVRPGSNDPNDVVVKVHNCYQDAPHYNGPLRPGDSNWTADVRRACEYMPEETDAIYMPLPTFLDNFSCMQRCHINCGDRLSSPGEWNEYTAGGTSKYTTFRSNPVYLVENKTSRPAIILAEVRHSEPLYVDETNCKRYPYTGLTLMQPINSKLPPTPFITSGTHKSLQKGMMLDSREVCTEMELPPSSTCYLVPFTKDRGTYGRFHVSIYPDMAKVTLTPLRHAGLTLTPLSTNVKLDPRAAEEGTRLDFMVNDACDVHVLLHQTKITDPSSIKRGDAVGEDDVTMSAFNEYGIKVGSTGEATNSREHALVFKAPQAGRYSLVANCTSASSSEPCTAKLDIYTPTDIQADFVPVPADAKPLGLQSQSRFPTLSRTATAPNASRGPSRERTGGNARNVRRTDSLPPSNSRSASARRGSSDAAAAAAARRSSRGRR